MTTPKKGDRVKYHGSIRSVYGMEGVILFVPSDPEGRGYTIQIDGLSYAYGHLSRVHRDSFTLLEE